jgi:arylsulfatase A-like enzyme
MNLTEGGQLPLPDKEVTMAELLQKAGYTTSAIGKWSLGTPGNEGNPMKQGFDHFFGYYCQCMAHNYYPELVWRNRDTVKLSNKTVPVQVNWADFPLSYATEKVENSALLALEEALVFIENNREAPFFLYYASTLPHSNGEAPPDERFEVPGWGIYTDSLWTPVDKGYASMVSLIDSQMASILDKLEQLEIDEHTLVIFTSDNGPTKFAARFNSSGPYRGRKRDLYEGGIRVPLIAWWPGQISSGRESSEIAASYDLFATICDAAGIQDPVQGDGRSLLPHWRGEDEGGREFLYWEIWEGPNAPKQAVRVGNWKLIAHFFPHPDKRYVELYNLKQDPGEMNNLADMFPEKVMELKKILAREHEPYVHSAIAAR